MCLQDLLATFPELHLFGLEGSLSLQQRNARESWDDHGIINILWDDHWGYPWKPRMIPPRLGPWFCQKRRRLLVEEYSDFNGVASMATNNISQSSRANVLCCNCASSFLWKLMFTRLWFARASQPAEGPQETNFNGPWEHSSPSTGCSVPWIILGGDEREIKWNEQKFDSEFYLYIYIYIYSAITWCCESIPNGNLFLGSMGSEITGGLVTMAQFKPFDNFRQMRCLDTMTVPCFLTVQQLLELPWQIDRI